MHATNETENGGVLVLPRREGDSKIDTLLIFIIEMRLPCGLEDIHSSLRQGPYYIF
jgi:hypothetical protein